MDLPKGFKPKKDNLKNLLEGKIKKIPSKEYEFKLRADMPPGFKKNDRHPELPAMREFLMQYEGRTFKSPEVFEEILDKVESYLKRKKVRFSSDRLMREGMYLERYEGGFNNIDCFAVYCLSEGHAGVCQFGLLQKGEE